VSVVEWRAEIVKDALESSAMIAAEREKGEPARLAVAIAQDAAERGHVTGQALMGEHDVHFRAVPVCAEGCIFCCYQAVVGTTPEIVAVADHLRESLSPAALEKLRARITELASRTRELSVRDWYASHQACPLLDEKAGSCIAHEARPLVCRAANSLDVRACMDAFDGGSPEAPIPKSAFQEPAMQSAWLGSMAAMAEAGLDPEAYDLTQALVIALANEDVGERWARGDKPLAAARIPRTIERSRGYAALYDPARLVLHKRASGDAAKKKPKKR
jgi:Fe-S-cluster containining protein